MIDFTYIVRAYTGVDLATKKDMIERLRADLAIELKPLNFQDTRLIGEELLRAGVVREAELLVADQPPQSIAAPSPTVFICPSCQHELKHRTECDACVWLRFSSDRAQWNRAGACPRCGFSYRFDGSNCSHCGHSSEKY